MVSQNRTVMTALAGAIAGIAAFLGGYAVTFLWRGRDIEHSFAPIEEVLQLFEAEPIGTWRAVGWLFYSGHFVDTRISAEFGPIETTMYINLVSEGAGNLELLYLVPPALLVLAGVALAISREITDVTQGAKAGATVTIGYLLLVAVGLIVFSYENTRPDPVPAIVIAGVLYPLVFGAVGGAIGAAVRNDGAESEEF